MIPVLVIAAAGLTAGSIPMKLMGYSVLRVFMAAAVAVLHATTIMSAPSRSMKSVMVRALPMIYSLDFSP